MCGRYYIDDDTAREIDKLIRQVVERLHSCHPFSSQWLAYHRYSEPPL